MREIEIVYEKGCPNVEGAREALRAALASLGLSIGWDEWDRESPETPERLRGYGSPTILVDGRDVVQAASTAGNSCRLYEDGQGGLSGVPPLERIIDALRRG